MNILLVDDSEIDRWISEKFISLLSPEIKVKHTATVEQAIRYLSFKKQPDLILLDLFMYPNSGFHFLDLYSHMQIKHAPVIVLTSSLNISDKLMATQHPLVQEYREKPMNKKMFYSIMERMKLKRRLLDINNE
jgi:DNA-binding NtrC family response regulator